MMAPRKLRSSTSVSCDDILCRKTWLLVTSEQLSEESLVFMARFRSSLIVLALSLPGRFEVSGLTSLRGDAYL